MPSIPSLLPIAKIGQALDENGVPADPRTERATTRFLDEFDWYARALKRERDLSGTPY